MSPMPMPQILLIGDPPADDARQTLEAAGFPVTSCAYGRIDLSEVAKSQLTVFEVTPQSAATAQALCRRWRIELGELYIPFVCLCSGVSSAFVASALDSGADVCLTRPFSPAEFLAQAKALLRVQLMSARLMSRAGEAQQINHRLQQANQQIDSDIEMARRIHRGFMPSALPNIQRTSFAVCYRPRSRIGGDFFDVIRLDENHCAIYVADALGHGVPTSSLLSIFVKKSLQHKEISGHSYRLVPPAEVLGRLNRDLVGLGLPEPPFVTMLYLQLNCQDGSLCFTRASHPHPLYAPEKGNPEYWSTTGTPVGVFEAEFTQHNHSLKSGDRVLLMSDGVSISVGGTDQLTECVNKHRAEALQSFIDNVAQDLLESSNSSEDFTLVGVEYR
jgi:phosphoserine phosphatase RsbU/P